MHITYPRITPAGVFRRMTGIYGLPKYLGIELFRAVQGTWPPFFNANQTKFHHDFIQQAGVVHNSTLNDNDEIEIQGITVKRGRHKITISGITNSGAGILEVLFGASSFGTQDLYSAGTVYNVQKVFYLNTIVTQQVHLRIKCSGKNGASSGYEIPISAVMTEDLMADEN